MSYLTHLCGKNLLQTKRITRTPLLRRRPCDTWPRSHSRCSASAAGRQAQWIPLGSCATACSTRHVFERIAVLTDHIAPGSTGVCDAK